MKFINICFKHILGETYPLRPPSVSTVTSTSSSLVSTMAETESVFNKLYFFI